MMARAGKPVILVDADFRRPSQHKFFGLKNDRGLYNMLNDADDHWETYAQTTEIEGLRVVTSGPLPPDPAALLDSPAMARWIERLKRGSDIVIIDTRAASLGDANAGHLHRRDRGHAGAHRQSLWRDGASPCRRQQSQRLERAAC